MNSSFGDEEFVYPDVSELPEVSRVVARAVALKAIEEGVSTRLLIYTGELIAAGIAPRRAATASIISAISDDASVQEAVADIVDVILP